MFLISKCFFPLLNISGGDDLFFDVQGGTVKRIFRKKVFITKRGEIRIDVERDGVVKVGLPAIIADSNASGEFRIIGDDELKAVQIVNGKVSHVKKSVPVQFLSPISPYRRTSFS